MASTKSANLQAVLDKLRDDKRVRTRQEGLSALQSAFTRDALVESLQPADWIVVFQALFDALVIEKGLCFNKRTLAKTTAAPGATALRRLGEIASAIRWLTERSVHRMSGKTLKALLPIFMSNLKHRGSLLAPVALDFVKAIKCIVSWKPHLDHIEEAVWVNLVELGFNVVLGDRLNKSIEEDVHEGEGSAMTEAQPADDSDSVANDEDDEDSMPSTPSKKRRRKGSRQPSHSRYAMAGSSKLQATQPVSLEQIEFNAVLAILLRSPSAPILSSDYPFLPAAILTRLQRFLWRFPNDSSLQHDYLHALSATLSHLALNECQLVSGFAREAWPALVGMWGTKTQRLKEDLVIIFRILFPYLTMSYGGEISNEGYSDGVARLWRLLEAEVERRGVEGLSLESLRLQVILPDDDEKNGAFVAETFRYGWHFDVHQALAWAILELQADCAEKLFLLSESVHAITIDRSEGKRIKLENPITALLHSIQTQSTPTVRAHHLQTLLFFVDRHWSILHSGLQQDIINTLLQFLSFDDPLIQSWAFMCFASIAHARGITVTSSHPTSSQQPSQPDQSTWDAIWTHAMRRSTVPAVSRAACHTAQTLLLNAKALLSPQRVLAEVETLAKDLDVQGPSFPYDAVCAFLTMCVRVASHDVRLYRMQLEEKVLTWFMDAWRPGGINKSRMAPYSVEDILSLLGSICGISNRASLVCSVPLQDFPIVSAMIDEHDTAVIRDFLLYAQLPHFRGSNIAGKQSNPFIHSNGSTTSQSITAPHSNRLDRDLVQPRGRERRISGFFLKSLEELIQTWEGGRHATGHLTAERIRTFLDLPILALCFEATLVTNGTRSNRRVIQASCKLLGIIFPLITDRRWTEQEKLLMLLTLEPLIFAETSSGKVPTWETMLPPGPATGIRIDMLQKVSTPTHPNDCAGGRRELQRVVLQSSDVQDTFASILEQLRSLLRVILGQPPVGQNPQTTDMDGQGSNAFAAIPKDVGDGSSPQRNAPCNAPQSIPDICVKALAIIPVLQSTSGEPTRDKELTNIVLNCDLEDVFVIVPPFLDSVKQRVLSLSVGNLDGLLLKIEQLLKAYSHSSRSHLSQSLVIHLLDSTMHIWLQANVIEGDVGDRVRSFCGWLSKVAGDHSIGSWRTRDQLACLLDRYLSLDPCQSAWVEDKEESQDLLPTALLHAMGGDADVRVRFRTAVANARLFSVPQIVGEDPMDTYTNVKNYLCTNINDYEHMISRMLCLGNIMVASSAVRRGPYWHLLETCLHTTLYTAHVEAVLGGVASRLGLSSFSQLFESYASQIAYSIRQSGQDFLRLPPHLLGYRDRRECAEAAFHAFSPTNVLAGGTDHAAIAHGRKLFEHHCRTIQKSPAEGIEECFAEIIGYQIVSWVDDHMETPDLETTGLEELLRIRTKEMESDTQYEDYLCQHADGVVATILRTLGDQDYSPNGSIMVALQSVDESHEVVSNFEAMNHYRGLDDVKTHHPNLPAYNTLTVLRALWWFKSRVPQVEQHSTTYHVLHQLFADLGRTPLVNEQMKLLSAMSLWASLHRKHFQDFTVLRTLVNGATTILLQFELARSGQSMLEWAFQLYQHLDLGKDSRLAEILIRISCAAYDYLSDSDMKVSSLGSDILRWAESQAIQLSKHKALKVQVAKALCAWPQELSASLRSLCPEPSSGDLSAILNDDRISSNKFRLVRRLRDLAGQSLYEDAQFSRCDFWRLKDCIPPRERLLDEDVDAFCDLLVLQRGMINGLGSEQSTLHTVRSRHLRGIKRKEKDAAPVSEDSLAPQRAIIASMLTILNGPSVAQVHMAYRTLRALVSVSSFDEADPRFWPSEYRGELKLLADYPRPFKPVTPPKLAEILSEESYLDMAGDFTTWITHMAPILSDTLAATEPFYAPLSTILRSDPNFSEQVLPVLVHTALQVERSPSTPNRDSCTRETLSRYFAAILHSDHADISCRRSIVDTVLHLRHFKPKSSKDALLYDKWLDIDYMLLSKNAIMCGAYTTALLFLELAAEHNQSMNPETPGIEEVLFDIYSHIDEPDGFYGIKTQDWRRFLIKRFHHEKQWDKAFQFHGAGLEAGGSDSVDAHGLVQALHSFGFDHLAIGTLHASPGANSLRDSNPMTYQLGWRTETWDLPELTEQRDTGAPLYLALRAVFRERDADTAHTIIRRALSKETEQLRGLGDENLTEIRQVSQNLMCLNQVMQWRSSSIQQSLQAKAINTRDWAKFTQIDEDFDFPDQEAIMATRVSLLHSVRQKEQREQIGTMLAPFSQQLLSLETSCLLRLSEAARQADQTQIALNSVIRAEHLNTESGFEVSQEFANVLWLMKEPKFAVQYLKSLLPTLQQDVSEELSRTIRKASLLSRLGKWSAEACLEKPAYITSEFFDPAAKLVTDFISKSDKLIDSSFAGFYHDYAIFAERQYHAVAKSPDTLRWKVYVDRKTEEMQRRQEQMSKMSQTHKDYRQLDYQQKKAKTILEEDKRQFQEHILARDTFLTLAVDMYSRSLQASDMFDDDSTIRLCSLWFSNFDYDEGGFQKKIGISLERVPSRKFVFLAHQLSARLSKGQAPSSANSQETLQHLVVRMCQEHPFHSLYQVYCLKADSTASQLSRRQSGRMESPSSQANRASAAAGIFERLRGDDTCGARVHDVERVCDASLQWAKHPIKGRIDEKQKVHNVPEHLLIRKIHGVHVPVITAHTPIDPTGKYDNCTWIDHYDATYETAGGINLPKISNCYGIDGIKYKQLFKGEGGDDLRQDAVMEQVFDLVNIVLRHDRETRKRNLSVRGYKVLPLAAQAGVLEFVGNTTPLFSWLSYAHRRYRPQDMSANDLCEQMKVKREQTKHDVGQVTALTALFTKLCERYKPVMRHYFTERHKTPMSWFRMRLNYARSLATTSIVGHVLGLGDRHTSNILIDNGTGEMVHIDLGIAFDQGKLLGVPERVPFRLTRDMVDGLGTSGTQGVFQRCAEETLRVLRSGSEVILTVLEVFKYDPLHSWTASELKVKRVQGTGDTAQLTEEAFRLAIGIDMASGTADEAADRALSSVNRKLDKTMTVEYTINELIADATDMTNLANMYIGWAPHY